MTKRLDLLDIQGNVIRAYGRFGYPVARYIFLNIVQSEQARLFLQVLSKKVTTSIDWGNGVGQIKQPDWTVNVAFSYPGLKELHLPRESLNGFSAEFIAGMKKRKDMIGDNGASDPKHWDPIWQAHRTSKEKDIHIFVSLNARTPEKLEESYLWLTQLVKQHQTGVLILGGHRGDDGQLLDYQDAKIVMENGLPTAKEHFGYTDGIGDPVFEGTPNYDLDVRGRGKQMADGKWEPLATGEFLLGHVDEAKEYPPAPQPVLLAKNGTYMVYRKLHENVATFESYLEEHGKKYPGGKELLAAKFVGRWRDNGAPLTKAPNAEKKQEFDMAFQLASPQEKDKLLSDFTYDEDMSGGKCPFSAHIRRINPRASLEMVKGVCPGSMMRSQDAFDTPGALTNRRRILRRGLPYGDVKDRTKNDGNHGIIIMMLNANINRQFEFVQQQWVNYGNDFQSASEKEILIGSHSADEQFPSKAVLQVEPESKDAPYFLSKIPRFVETRGGEYFFIPSLTALKMIAKGVIDPT